MAVGTNAELRPGQLLGGRYRLDEAYATDPLVHVWRAHDIELRRPVVCKLLHPTWMDDEDMVERFRFGAFAATRLDHENIARTYDVEQDDGLLYTVSEHIDGPDLGALLVTAPLAVEVVAAVGLQAAAGLGAAHERGLAHGDVRPQNLVIGSGGRLCLIDFGSVQAVETPDAYRVAPGAEPVSRDYWAPERREAGEVHREGDVYSLGLVLWEALTGEPVVGTGASDEREGLFRRVLDGITGADDDLEPRLRQIMTAATANDPAQRPSATELVDQFVEVAGVRPHDHLAPLLAERDGSG